MRSSNTGHRSRPRHQGCVKPAKQVEILRGPNVLGELLLIAAPLKVPTEPESGLPVARWEKRGWLKRRGGEYVLEQCGCGSEDLGLIPTPEPKGLVCLACRRDVSGLTFPDSRNVAAAEAEY